MGEVALDARTIPDRKGSPTESDLTERAIVGDRIALKQMIARVVPRIRQQLQASIPVEFQSVLSIDDVIQEALVSVFLSIGSFVPRKEDSFAAWVSEIARNTLREAVRMLRTQKRGGHRKRLDIACVDDSRDLLLDQIVVSTTTPSRHFSQLEMRNKLDNAIEQLPAISRQVIRLYDIDLVPAEHVATAIDRSVGAMYMIRARAIRKLSEMLDSELSR